MKVKVKKKNTLKDPISKDEGCNFEGCKDAIDGCKDARIQLKDAISKYLQIKYSALNENPLFLLFYSIFKNNLRINGVKEEYGETLETSEIKMQQILKKKLEKID